MQRLFITLMVLFTASFAFAQGSFESQIDASVKAIEKKMIDWRTAPPRQSGTLQP
jgi:hypothetical protein